MYLDLFSPTLNKNLYRLPKPPYLHCKINQSNPFEVLLLQSILLQPKSRRSKPPWEKVIFLRQILLLLINKILLSEFSNVIVINQLRQQPDGSSKWARSWKVKMHFERTTFTWVLYYFKIKLCLWKCQRQLFTSKHHMVYLSSSSPLTISGKKKEHFRPEMSAYHIIQCSHCKLSKMLDGGMKLLKYVFVLG